MKKRVWLLILLACVMTPSLVMAADAPVVVDAPPIAPAPPDIVTLKDGSVIYGEVVGMEGGILLIKTDAPPTRPSSSIGPIWRSWSSTIPSRFTSKKGQC